MSLVTTIAQLLVHPPLGAMVPALDADGPYTEGDYTKQTWRTAGGTMAPAGTYNVSATYGVVVNLRTAPPPTWGYDIGWSSHPVLDYSGYTFHNRIAQIVLQRQLLTGLLINVAETHVHQYMQPTLWDLDVVGVLRFGLHVEPGLEVDLYWLCLL